MDVLKTVREIGFFEMGLNLVKVIDSNDVKLKAGAVMPLPERQLAEYVEKIVEWLNGFDKNKYMFLTPEIAIIERMAKINNQKEAIILIPCDMETEVKERLKENLPKEMKTELLEEPYFPEKFLPGNGILVICGYMAGKRLMVLSESYRMIEHYSGFHGKKVFVPYTEIADAIRYEGWMEVGACKFSNIWRAM